MTDDLTASLAEPHRPGDHLTAALSGGVCTVCREPLDAAPWAMVDTGHRRTPVHRGCLSAVVALAADDRVRLRARVAALVASVHPGPPGR